MKKLSSSHKRKIKMIPQLGNLNLVQEYHNSSVKGHDCLKEDGFPTYNIFEYNMKLEEEILRRMN